MAFVEDFIGALGGALGNDYLVALAILLMGYLLSRLVHYTVHQKFKKWAENTKTDIDDVVIGILEKPVEDGVMVVALYLAIISLNSLSQYSSVVSDAFFVIGTLWIAKAMQNLISFIIPRWIQVANKRYERSPKLISRIIAGVVYIIALMVILGHFNIEITPIIAALGIGGLAVGLALQDGLSNFFAGIYIVSGNPVKVGDFIELPAEKISGYVEDISWRASKIKTLQDSIVIVPNSKLSQAIIINTHLPNKEIAVLVECGVSYDSDLEKVEKVTLEVATEIQKTIPGAVKTFTPMHRYHTFGDSNIQFTVVLKIEEFTNRFVIINEFIKALKKRYDKEGISISQPVRKMLYVNPPVETKQETKLQRK